MEEVDNDSNTHLQLHIKQNESPQHNTLDRNEDVNSSSADLTKCGCRASTVDRVITYMKYTYVIGVIVIAFTLAALQQISPPIDDFLDKRQAIILEFLIEDNIGWILLVLFVVTVLKSVGVKDVLGLRTISVVILSYKLVASPLALTFLLAMTILGVLSSISKLTEYRVIGRELQVVQGTPVAFVFKYLRKMLMCAGFKDEAKLEWVDPHWTFEISEMSRRPENNDTMDILTNLETVVLDVGRRGCCRCRRKARSSQTALFSHTQRESPTQSTTATTATTVAAATAKEANNTNDDDVAAIATENENDTETETHHSEQAQQQQQTDTDTDDTSDKIFCCGKTCCMSRILWKILYFVIAVIWTSTIEWVQPITELFMYAHNWRLSWMKATIIVLSEFCDFDKMVETWFLIYELDNGQDIISAKVGITFSKALFWALGYTVILPPTLFWAHRYHQIMFTQNVEEQSQDTVTTNNAISQ